jgi:transposase
MSMQPKPWPEVPAATAKVARAAFRKGSLAIRARDELGAWYADGDFAAAYGVRGAPGMSPAQLAMVTVLQFAENLTDRQAADAVRGRLDWKYCLGLALDDEGFDFSVLSEFRSRLVAAGLERSLFELLLARLKELGLVGPGGTARTDSTHVLGAIRDLNRLELAGETVRAALETLAAAAPDWLAGVIDASWQEVYGQRIDEWRLPASQARRQDLAAQYGRDGYHLLEAAWAPGAPGWLRELPAVETLRRVWVQQYTRGQDGTVTRREAGFELGLPPGRSRITSPYDTGARYSEKRGKGWRGYKVHLTETCTHPASGAGTDGAALPGGLPSGRAAPPNLITNVATTMAAVPDAAMTEPVHDMLAAAGLTPGEHAADAGYAGADLLLAARARGITLLAPLAVPSSPQARAGGYTADMFTIDWDRQQVTRHRHPRQPDRPAVERPLRHPGRRRSHHPPGHRRHRHPHRPLPRTTQNQPRTRSGSHSHQPDPPRRLADQQTTRPDPHHSPPAAQPRRLNPNKPTESRRAGNVGRWGQCDWSDEAPTP